MLDNKKNAEIAFHHWLTCYQDKYPKVAGCLVKDKDHLLEFFNFPAKHWSHIRTTNPIESTFSTITHSEVGNHEVV